MKLSRAVLFTVMMGASIAASAQGTDPNKITRLQDTRLWEKEIPAYQKVLSTGKSPAVMEKLADCYRMTGDLEQAELWYRQALSNGNQSSALHLNFAKVLQSNGKYQEAKSQFKVYEEISGQYEIGEKYIASCEMAMKVKNDQNRYVIRPVSKLNTASSDIIAINGKEEIVFATRGKRKEIGVPSKNRRSTDDYDFYRATKGGDGSITGIQSMKGGINSSSDDVSAVKMPGSDLILFTRSGEMTSSKKTVGDKQPATTTNEVSILGARANGKKVGAVENLPFNLSDGHHNFHPAIHPNGDVIIFASDRPGGYGGVDLYMVQREGGKWTKPINLGPEINSEGDELFPTFNKEGNVFFASDGHIGYGGLDLYTADYKDNRWQHVNNMGTGINSSKDDFAIVWDPATSSGYFTSNRNVATGDDIYSFSRTPGINGQIFDGMSREALAGSIVRLRDVNGNEKIIITDGVGQFSEPCKPNSGYILTVDAPGFHTWRDTFWTKNIPQGRDVNMDIFLEVEQVFEMTGRVTDERDGHYLGDAQIEVVQAGAIKKTLASSADSADYRVRLQPGQDYSVVFRKEGYIPRILNLSLANFRGVETRERNVPMVKGDYVLLQGTIIEESQKSPLQRAAVAIIDNRTQTIVDSTMSLANGTFTVALPWDSLANYSIIGSKAGFLSKSLHLDKREGKEMNVTLGLDEAKFGLEHSHKVIFYNYNEANLDLLSKKDLNEIYVFLMENMDAKLEIRSHTDSRGTKQYNLELSRRRSDAVIKYIQARRQIPDERFISWGFGEEYLLNDCVDGKPCTEDEHAKNRRTEIKIVER
jgi:outer membrane protein OmpA-like peptidoglycan-associated protein